MFYIAYNIFSICLLLPVLIFNIYRAFRLGWPMATAEHFGFIPQSKLSKINNRPVIWLHAVSVGEAIAAKPLIRALRYSYPGHAIVVSNTTETGKTTSSQFPEVDLCLYFPFDFIFSVRSVLGSVNPAVIIIMETEIWPNFSHEASKRNIPLILANGRISDRSYKRYLKFSWFFRPSLRCFTAICMQSEVGLERIIAIGADPEITVVAGNLKNDIAYHKVDQLERRKLRAEYAIDNDCCVLTAGSTHDGEEQSVINTYIELSSQISNLCLVLVPRHPERVVEVSNFLDHAGLRYKKRTQYNDSTILQRGEILLIDTVGELMKLYALSDIAYVGGSLAPIGGHNLLEPASVGVPSIFGPYMANFREIEALTLHYGAGIQIQGSKDLTAACMALITSADLRRVMGQNGLKLLRDNGGATERHMGIISKFL